MARRYDHSVPQSCVLDHPIADFLQRYRIEGFLDRVVLADGSCLALLEHVVEPLDFDDFKVPILRLFECLPNLGQVQFGKHLQVLRAGDRKYRTGDFT